jgi:hypothetical protein
VATQKALALLGQIAAREQLVGGAVQQSPPPQQPQFAGPQTPFQQAVAADLRQQFPNEAPEQIDQRVTAVTGAMTSGQTFYPEVQGGLRINQPNWERFLAAQPRSRNIEDRRR